MPSDPTDLRELLLGFTLRVVPANPRAMWPDARRRAFLLNAHVVAPLSVDTVVLPNALGYDDQCEDLFGRTSIHFPDSNEAMSLSLWLDRSALLHYVASTFACDASCTYYLLAVSIVAAASLQVGRSYATAASHIAPPTCSIQPPLVLLGYDVADRWLTSGLMNCAYDAGDSGGLDKWRSRINEHHLFDDVGIALQFATITDRRVPEHAPFFVYSLRLWNGHLGRPPTA